MAIRPIALLASAALLAGCGGSGGDDATTATTGTAPVKRTALALTLDFAPNAVHAGLYLARQRGLYRDGGIDLTINVPGSGADGTRLLAAGRSDLAIMDIHDLAIAREKGADLVAVGAIVQRPLASLIAAPGVSRPRALEGRRVGVTGLPSDDAAVDQIVRGDGGDPRKVRRVTIGFEAVPAVLGGRVAAATAFWNAEGVAVKARRPKARIFRLDEFGAPRYPELLLVSTSKLLARRGDVIQRFLAATAAGYQAAATTPTAQSQIVIDALQKGSGDKTIDPSTTADQLKAVTPTFLDREGRALAIDRAAMARWARWEAHVGITKRAPDVAKLIWKDAPGG
ncbi:hydroxymethylpyrimidine-binding protein [Patulibacter medicamentivorans]|uniref:Thiamine pyrimidine synthase n=1 Tax=Patulibacter medicamentivorans TaxID=1097667 RepID=H0E4K5_9ACTN|nr:ABC transporter substrate-binding protein [Patulibacter medicamentivorans]EHN11376.1 hydroxymethylpyrimidine-binding protein [Patulibacter medicamentivorans]